MTTIDRPAYALEPHPTAENGVDFRVQPEILSLTQHFGLGAAKQAPPPGDAPSPEAGTVARIGEYLAGAAAGVWWKDRAKNPRITISRAGARLSITFVAVDDVGIDDVRARLRELIDELDTMVNRDRCRPL